MCVRACARVRAPTRIPVSAGLALTSQWDQSADSQQSSKEKKMVEMRKERGRRVISGISEYLLFPPTPCSSMQPQGPPRTSMLALLSLTGQ